MVTLIPVKNMNRAVKFYTKTLGGKKLERARGAMKNFWAGLKLGDHDVWLITPEKWEKRNLAYTTFLVKSIKPFVHGLMKKGVKFQRAEKMGPKTKIDGPIAHDEFGASAFFKDSEGNVLMVWQNMIPM
ncbi:MAG: VOC family protein [Thermoplasmata archaeon]|nr:VOC family protein [Thermoplasmata archaeon]